MKKILATSLIGLLSLLIQLNTYANNDDVSTKTNKTDTTKNDTDNTDIVIKKEADNTEITTKINEADNTENEANQIEPVEKEATTDKTETEDSLPEEKITIEATKKDISKPAKEKQPDILGESIDIYSLRGDNKISDESEAFPNHRIMVVDGGIDVTFDDQPPMVPHSIDKDRISLQENTCLKCHSKADSKLENAPKPTPSHFKGRAGKKESTIVAGRYFCTQCHTPQANKAPLINNYFAE